MLPVWDPGIAVATKPKQLSGVQWQQAATSGVGILLRARVVKLIAVWFGHLTKASTDTELLHAVVAVAVIRVGSFTPSIRVA